MVGRVRELGGDFVFTKDRVHTEIVGKSSMIIILQENHLSWVSFIG